MYVDQPAVFFTLSISNRDSLQLCAPGEGVFLQSLKKLLKKQFASMMCRKSAPCLARKRSRFSTPFDEKLRALVLDFIYRT